MLALLPLLLAPQEPDWIDRFLEGSRALEQGAIPAARSSLEAALEILPRHPATAWQLASACARAGETDAAFAWLDRAVEWGGGEAPLLEWDEDLASLREDPRFRALLEKLRVRDAEVAREPLVAEFAWNGSGGFSLSASEGAHVVASGRGSSTFLRDLWANEMLAVLDRPGQRVAWVEVSHDGKWAATTGSGEGESREEHFVRIFDGETGDFVRDLEDVGWEARIEFSRDGKRMAAKGATSHQGDGAVWDTDSWRRISRIPSEHDQWLFSPDGRRLLLLSRHGPGASQISFWDVDEAKYLKQHPDLPTVPLTNLAFSSDGELALAMENMGRALHVYEAHGGDEIRRIEPGEARFTGACFLGVAGKIATLDEKASLRVWDARSGDVVRDFETPGQGWRLLMASPDGRVLLVHSMFGPLTAHDAISGDLLWSCGEDPRGVTSARFTPDGSRVVTGEYPIHRVRDARTGAVVASLESPGLDTGVRAHPLLDELWIGAGDGSLRRVTAASGRGLGNWRHGRSAILGLSFPRDGARLATIDRAGVLRVVDTTDGRLLATIPGAKPTGSEELGPDESLPEPQAEFAPNGSAVLLRGEMGRIEVFRAPDWQPSCIIDVRDRFAHWAWRPDGSALAVSKKGGEVALYDLPSGNPVQRSMRIEGEVYTMAFEPDGKRLWVGGDQSKVHIFDTESGAVVRALDLQDLDGMDTVELGTIAFRAEGQLAVTTSSGFGVVAAWERSTGQRVWSYTYDGGNPGALLTAFGASGDRVYVWGQGYWSPRIVDAKDGHTLLDLAGRVGSLLPFPNERLVGAEGPEGLEAIDTENGQRRWSRIELADDHWLLNAPSRHVDGTRAALEQIQLVLPERSYPLDALAAVLLDPKKVRAAADGVAITPARLLAIPQLHWATPQRPVLRVEHDAKPPRVTLEASCPDGIAGFELRFMGHRTRSGGNEVDATRRSLTLELGVPEPGETIHYRWRAIGASGVMSRALHLTLQGED